MHHDVTLNDVTANINQRYSNSLLSPSGVYLFQAGNKRSDSWVWGEVMIKEREEKKIIRGEIREDHPLPYPLAIFPAHIFLCRPHNLSQRLEWAGLNREGAYIVPCQTVKQKMVLILPWTQITGTWRSWNRRSNSSVVGTSTSRIWARHVHIFFKYFLSNKAHSL